MEGRVKEGERISQGTCLRDQDHGHEHWGGVGLWEEEVGGMEEDKRGNKIEKGKQKLKKKFINLNLILNPS